MSFEQRFWSNVHRTPGCWFWTGTRRQNKSTYGQFKVGDTKLMAHRVSWELHFGEIPEGLFVLHKCDTPSCVRPSHLFLGTKGENNTDRHRKGRTVSKRKFSDEDIDRIRNRLARGYPRSEIQAEFGIDSGYLSRVARGLVR